MVITGIRHLIGTEIDVRRSASFTKYLLHYLRMFAMLGIIVPLLIGVDYIIKPQTENETVTNKFYLVTDNVSEIEYHIFTGSRRFIANANFYEHIGTGDQVTYYYTPIFKTVTNVTYQAAQELYQCNPRSIYGWSIIVAALTLVCSIILLIKIRSGKRKTVKSDSVINLGIINAFLCIFTLVTVLFHSL